MQIYPETFDLLIIAAPFVVVALLAVSVVVLLFRCYRTSLAFFLVALTLNVLTEQVPVHLPHAVPAQREPGTLRVLTYNICGKIEYAPIHVDPSFREYFLRMDADFVFLPENNPGICPSFDDFMRSQYPYSLHCFPDFEGLRTACKDLTLYSHYPLSDYKNYEFDPKEVLRDRPYLDSAMVAIATTHFMAYEVTADVHGRKVTLLHLHMRSNNYDHAKTEADDRLHKLQPIYDNLILGYSIRHEEARVIARQLSDCPNPLLVCGDFNDLSGSSTLRIIQDCRRDNPHAHHRDRLRDAWWSGGLGFGFTFKDQHLLLRLDHILYSREFRLKAVMVDDQPFSDHLPLVADFDF